MSFKLINLHYLCYLLILFLGLGLEGCSIFPSTSRFVRENEGNEKVLVFIHGVGGSSEDTWRRSQNSRSWLDLVKEDNELQDFDVLTLGYYKTPSIYGNEKPQKSEEQSIYDLAESLYRELLETKIFSTDGRPHKYNKVYFAAHSMGNLVVRTALLTKKVPNDVNVPLLLSFASPSRGSHIAKLAYSTLGNYPQLKDMEQIEGNSFLSLLNDLWDKAALDTEIACAYEKDPIVPGIFVVDKASATSACDRKDFPNKNGAEAYRGLSGDHMEIVKPPIDITKEFEAHTWLKSHLKKKSRRKGWQQPRWVDEGKIIIGGKDYLESNFHLEIMAQVIENAIASGTIKGLEGLNHVERRYAVGNSVRTFYKLKDKKIDLYPEYSGTIYHEHLGINPILAEELEVNRSHDPEEMNRMLRNNSNTSSLVALPHFQEHNPYVLVMRDKKTDSVTAGTSVSTSIPTNISDLKTPFVLHGGTAFMYRLDGLPGMQQAYGFGPGQIHEQYIAHSNVYTLLDKSPTNTVAIGYGTDWELNHRQKKSKYIQLKDDKNFFPKYFAGPFVHEHVLKNFPGIRTVFNQFAGLQLNDYKELSFQSNKPITLKDMACLLHKGRNIRTQNLRENNESDKFSARNELRDIVKSFLHFKKIFPKELSRNNSDDFETDCEEIYKT